MVYEKSEQSEYWAKPKALQFLLARLEEEGRTYDVYVVLDADNVADPSFCRELSRAFDRGFHAVQGRREARKLSESWVTDLATVSEMATLTELAGRDRLGLSSYLRGSAMGFTAELLDRIGGVPQCADDAIGFQAMCAVCGFRIGWCPSAIVLDEQVSSYQHLSGQRWRWFWIGSHTVPRLALRLFVNTLRSPTLHKIEQVLYLFRTQIPHSMLIVGSLVLLVVAVVRPTWVWPRWVWGGLLAGYGTHIVLVLCRNRASPRACLSLLLAPLFVLTYVWILVSVLFGKRGARGKTEHRGRPC